MAREGSVDEDNIKLLDRITNLRSKTNLQLPEIERTILKLSRQPNEGTLWARLLQRVAGWAMGLTQVLFPCPTGGRKRRSALCCKWKMCNMP
jgi:hypothetical protein